jgi:hypothetical protein
MSAIGRLRKKMGYENNIARCENCKNYKRPYTWYLRGVPKKAPPFCKLGEFTVSPVSICDNWCSPNGVTLEGV